MRAVPCSVVPRPARIHALSLEGPYHRSTVQPRPPVPASATHGLELRLGHPKPGVAPPVLTQVGVGLRVPDDDPAAVAHAPTRAAHPPAPIDVLAVEKEVLVW